jgi:hypothetical protein
MQKSFYAVLSDFHSPYALNLLDTLFANPVCTTAQMRTIAGIKNNQTALNLIRKFEKSGILMDISPNRKRDKTYAFMPLLDIIDHYGERKH